MESLCNTASGKGIAVLGFDFKKDTTDTRESPSIDVCRDLLQEQAQLAIYDPKVLAEQVHADLQPAEGSGGEIEICSDPYQAAVGAQVVAVMTEWDDFRDLDYQRIYDSMLKPALIFDGRNILDLEPLREMGFKAEGIGKG